MRELKLRSDDTPDYTGSEKHASAGAREAILLVRRAHVLCRYKRQLKSSNGNAFSTHRYCQTSKLGQRAAQYQR